MPEVLVQGAKGVKRRRTLEPYLVKVQEVLRRETFDPGRSRRLSIEGVAVSLEPWVVACVEMQAGDPGDNAELAELLGQSVALWLKSALDVRSLRRELKSGASNLYEEQAKLMLDSALGAALLQELQGCIDTLVKGGNFEDAKRLSKFRGQVSVLVRELKQVISDSNGPSEDGPAEPLAEATENQTSAPVAVARSLPREPDPELRARVRRPRPAAAKPRLAEPGSSPSKYRTQILVVLNVVALVVSIVLKAPSPRYGKTPRALEAHHFEDATALVEIVARPPALYASVDSKVWSAYDPGQQRRFVDSMGSVLQKHGYWGLTLKTSDGRLVGQWLENGGSRLLRGAPEGPTTPGRAAAEYSRFVP